MLLKERWSFARGKRNDAKGNCSFIIKDGVLLRKRRGVAKEKTACC